MTVEAIEEALKQKDWGYKIVDVKGKGKTSKRAIFRVRTRETDVGVELFIPPSDPVLVGKVLSPYTVKKHLVGNVTNLMSLINSSISFGGIELDENSMPVFKHSIMIKDLDITSDFIDAFIVKLIREALMVMPAVRAVAGGESAKIAADLIC